MKGRFVDKKTSNLVLRRDYSKVTKNFSEPNLLSLQKKAFQKFIDVDLEKIIKSIFPIRSARGRYQLDYEGIKLGEVKRSYKQAKNEGKTYYRPLYLNLSLTIYDEVSNTRKVKHSKDIFFVDIPIITERGTFIVNGIEKFVIAQILRSPGAYILTKSQIKLNNFRKKVQQGNVCEVLPVKGTMFLVFRPENKDYIQVMFRDISAETVYTISVTTLLKAFGLNAETILQIFDYHPAIVNSLQQDEYNADEIFLMPEIVNFKKNFTHNYETQRAYGIENHLRNLLQQYFQCKKEKNQNASVELERRMQSLTDAIICEKAAKDLVQKLSLSTRTFDARIRFFSKENAHEKGYQYVLLDHFFNIRNYDLSSAGRFKVAKKMRLSERIYERILAEDLCDLNGKILVAKNTLIQKEELDLLKQKAKANDLQFIEQLPLNATLKCFFESVRYEKIKIYQDNETQKEVISIIGTDPNFQNTTLHLSDIFALISYVINLPYYVGFYDDIDHLGNKRLKLIDELLKSKIALGLNKIEKFINDKLTIADAVSENHDYEHINKNFTAKSIINTKPIQLIFKEFFNSHQLTQFLDQQNPLAELTNKRRISAMGPGGISREDPNLNIRDVHYSYYGKICPIETPEGLNIGLIMTLAAYATTDENGFLITPYWVVKNGKITDEIRWLNALSEDEYIIACANLSVKNKQFCEPKVLCRYRSSWEFFDIKDVDFIDISSKQVVSIAAGAIPFLENNDANRALMGANMQRQAVPLIAPIAPIVGTGNEYKIAHDSGMALIYTRKETGKVIYVDGKKIKIKHAKGIEEYELLSFNRSNQNTWINQTPLVNVGDQVEYDDVLADGPAMNNGELALGQNILVAFTTWHGYNYEDAIVLSERLFIDDVFTSIHIVEYTIECLKTKNGDEEITRDIPNITTDSYQARYLDDEGIIMVGAEVKEGDILVGKISPKGQVELSSEEKLLQAIFGDKSKNHKDTSLRVPNGGDGTVALVKRFKVEDNYELNFDVIEQIKVFIVQKRKIQIGDKIAGRHGNKGIISKIVPIEDMPYLEDGTPVDIMLSPLGVPSRMNIGQILEVHLGWAMKKITMRKILEFIFQKAVVEQFVLWFGINKNLASNLIQNIQAILTEKQITNLAQAYQLFSEFDFTIALNRSGISHDRLIYKVATPVFEGVNRHDLEMIMQEANMDPFKSLPGCGKDGKFNLIDGRSGEYFDSPITVGLMYMLKLDHMVEDKIHARAVGPYSKITQQPLGGKSQNGGQRFGEMEVWALEAYGAAYNLRELLTIKSDDVRGRNHTYNSIIKGEKILGPGLPESFKLLIKQLQGLGLQINITQQPNEQNVGKVTKKFEDLNKFITQISR